MHTFEGAGFCTVPLDGVPCLHARTDRTCHVQPYAGMPNAKGEHASFDRMSHQIRVATMNQMPIRYLVMNDFNAYRRCCIGQHTTLERCQLDLDDPRNQDAGQMWVEDLLYRKGDG